MKQVVEKTPMITKTEYVPIYDVSRIGKYSL